MRLPLVPLSTIAGVGLLLSGCAASADSAGTTSDGTVQVVTATNVYGDIAKAIGGANVSVTSIITKPSQDPHSYEATAQDKLAISKAGLIIENGGGYDVFLDTMAEDTNVDPDSIVSAVEVSGLEEGDSHEGASGSVADDSAADTEHNHDHAGFNEHVWYNFDAMGKLADAVALKLGGLKPDAAADITANAATFKEGLKGLSAELTNLSETSAGTAVAITEPVPLYLLEAAGLENGTPQDYSSAIEEGTDVSPAVLKETTDLASSGALAFLAYNTQTEGPQTLAVKQAAEQAGVPVIDFSETLPDGKDYLGWMSENVNSVKTVLENK